MNLVDPRFRDFALVREMLQAPDVLRRFDINAGAATAREIQAVGRLFLTGEGSSRIFPAKNLMYDALRLGSAWSIATDGARQAHEYDLSHCAVFGASNSGKTKELISLFAQLAQRGHQARYGLTATENSVLKGVSRRCHTLTCGPEQAVAATKSVVEQAVFYRSLLCPFEKGASQGVSRGESPLVRNQAQAARKAKEVLEADLDARMIRAITAAPIVYFAGRNNGVAEELALKTNEIAHKKSDFLEGTYAVHGIEEVMNPNEVVVVVDPFPEEAAKFRQVLVDGVGMTVLAIAAEETIFPTIRIPRVEGYDAVLQLLAGWNILVHVGVSLGIDLDKAERARKIGNEFLGG
jgi:glucosamine--fructose-6-phosphate aminotransferase (isomerizing)